MCVKLIYYLMSNIARRFIAFSRVAHFSLSSMRRQDVANYVKILVIKEFCKCHIRLLFAFYLSAFWYRLTQVVLEKRPLNGCSS